MAFSENEVSQIDKYCKQDKIKLTSRTEFIRQAIFDKIRRIENPESYNHISKKFDVDQISEFLKEIKSSNEQQKEILKRLIVVDKIQSNFKVLKEMAKQPELEESLLLGGALLTVWGIFSGDCRRCPPRP